jgi:hypothetical protein
MPASLSRNDPTEQETKETRGERFWLDLRLTEAGRETSQERVQPIYRTQKLLSGAIANATAATQKHS